MMMMPITQPQRQVNPSRGVVAFSVVTIGITRVLQLMKVCKIYVSFSLCFFQPIWIQEERSFDAKVDSHKWRDS
ncbi:hypothetical protein RGQ29_015225 [Quercus rubra]|uniref:Uncharacterized protein n=2 Tax=Quercus rubra TaxID=3512 RepID=A0AAN7FPH3_QUERU|nr:hypothetical protein RGQ29_015225 [Quercus rubra]KAK4597619.1 hypothetical protein RGQ29_015225 [Quercus rubra]